jgi:hypothetical protein
MVSSPGLGVSCHWVHRCAGYGYDFRLVPNSMAKIIFIDGFSDLLTYFRYDR